MIQKKALFLDRDGIINVDKSYVYKFSDVEFVDGIVDLIKLAKENNFLVIVLTNQSGVERGYYQESDIISLHKMMETSLNEMGAVIDDWFYCVSLNSEDRKPNPGMMVKAQNKHNIDLTKSIMIGDKESDVLNIEGPKFIIVEGNYSLEKLSQKAYLVKNINEALIKFKELNNI